MHTFCTIVNRDYLPQAQVLVNSFKQNHPEGKFVTLIFDLETKSDCPLIGSDILVLSDLAIDAEVFKMRRLMYDVVEFATSLKPILLRHLLQNSETVTFLDPDIQIFSRLDHAVELTTKHGITLTAHRNTPIPKSHNLISEEDFFKYGIFNLGFICVSRKAIPMLIWWEEKLETKCTRFPNSYLFTDQKWIDLVPAYFEYALIQDMGYNVAPWNLDERNLDKKYSNFFVNDVPLVFIHFSQMSSLLSKGKETDHWHSINPKSFATKQSRMLIDDITKTYRNLLIAERERITKEFRDFDFVSSQTLAWPIREKLIRRFSRGEVLSTNIPYYLRIVSKIHNFIFRSAALTGLYQGLCLDRAKLRIRLRTSSMPFLNKGGTKSDF
jgi:hypothetical protein